MGNLHLVTGYAGREHVTSADQGAFHVAMFGGGQYVLDRGNKLSASIVTNSIVRVLDGEIYMQGRYIRLNEGTYVDLSIENGTQGYKRNDLIVARYTKDVRTGVEDCNLVVLKGDNSTETPADPAHTEGDLLVDHAVTNDVPLYRVVLNGLVTESVTPLFSVLTDIPDRLDAIKTDIKTNYAPLSHKKRHETGGADALSPADIGAVPTTRTINGKPLSANVVLQSDNINVPSSTASALGLGTAATIDKVLKLLEKCIFYTLTAGSVTTTDVNGTELSIGGSKVACGTYTGTGAYGTANPNSLEFGFAPTFVLLFNAAGRIGEEGTCMILLQGRTTAAAYNSKGSTVAWTDTGVSWYTDGTIPHYQMNVKNTPYVWLAVQ